MIGKEGRQAVSAAFTDDVTPQSGAHLFRFVIGTIILLVGIGDFVVTRIVSKQPWDFYGVLMNLSVMGAGLLIMFTKTIMEFIKAFPFPWKR